MGKLKELIRGSVSDRVSNIVNTRIWNSVYDSVEDIVDRCVMNKVYNSVSNSVWEHKTWKLVNKFSVLASLKSSS